MTSKLLVVTNGVIPSGYEKVARGLLKSLRDSFLIHHIAIGYRGVPLQDPWHIYPCSDSDRDRYGAKLHSVMHQAIQPDITLFINDGWALQQYAPLPNQWAYVAVDSPYMLHSIAERINQLTGVIFHTDFGRQQAIDAGVTIPTYVLPHGHDPQFKPMSKKAARKKLNIGSELYIVGNVNVNQKRKRFDLTLNYFAEWVKKHDLPKSVRLFLQPLKNTEQGTPIYLYANYLGIGDRLISTPIQPNTLITDEALQLIHNSFDVQMSTSTGESWGLTNMDGMMCGVPQIVPEWAGIGEWTADAAHQVPCTNVEVTHLGNVGGVADRELFINGLQAIYTNNKYRKWLKRAGYDRAQSFSWDDIGIKFRNILINSETPAE